MLQKLEKLIDILTTLVEETITEIRASREIDPAPKAVETIESENPAGLPSTTTPEDKPAPKKRTRKTASKTNGKKEIPAAKSFDALIKAVTAFVEIDPANKVKAIEYLQKDLATETLDKLPHAGRIKMIGWIAEQSK